MTIPMSPRSHEQVAHGRRWPWVLAGVALVLLVIWPLQALALAMLATTALMVLSVYGALTEHAALRGGLRRRIDRVLPVSLGVALAAGGLVCLAWPATLTPVVFVLLVLTCVMWIISELALSRVDHVRGRARARR